MSNSAGTEIDDHHENINSNRHLSVASHPVPQELLVLFLTRVCSSITDVKYYCYYAMAASTMAQL